MVLDTEGKVIHRVCDPEKGNYFYSTEGKPPVAYADLRKAMEPHKSEGLLGGLEVPARCAPIATAIKQGQLAAAQALLAKVPRSAQYAAFKAELLKRLEELSKKKLELLSTLTSEGKHWEAFKVASSYLACFPRSNAASDVKSKLATLKGAPEVKKNLSAAQSFKRLATGIAGPVRHEVDTARAQKLFERLAKDIEGTEYGDVAKAIAQ